MPTVKSKLDTSSPAFAANAEQMRAVVAELHAHTARVSEGGGKEANAKHAARGKLLPRDREKALLDANGFRRFLVRADDGSEVPVILFSCRCMPATAFDGSVSLLG